METQMESAKIVFTVQGEYELVWAREGEGTLPACPHHPWLR